MIHTGLVSVTFRQLAPQEIVDLVAEAGLDSIEWGGDVHVPHGEVDTARAVRRMTEDAGLALPSYGSYYRVGESDPALFDAVLACAEALGTPIIRVWAGRRGSAEADAAYWERVVADSRRCATLAADAGMRLAYEYHGNTLTDTDAAALTLLKRVAHDAVTTYWQMRGDGTRAQLTAGLRQILPWLTHLHIQSRGPGADADGRAPLAAMADTWADWLAIAAQAPGDHVAMLEFVKDDDPAQFLADAAVLKRIGE
jgi:3-dehydroshikimate dehydratase